nr:hypothetical protein CparaKRNrm1_p135 [Cryptomonas paramecium]
MALYNMYVSTVKFFLYLCNVIFRFFISLGKICHRLQFTTKTFYLFKYKHYKIHLHKIELQQIWVLNKRFHEKIYINKRMFFINLILKFLKWYKKNLSFLSIYFYRKLNIQSNFLFFFRIRKKKILFFRKNHLIYGYSYFFKKFISLYMYYPFDNFKNFLYHSLKLNLQNNINKLNIDVYFKSIFFSIKIIKYYHVKYRYSSYKFFHFFKFYPKDMDFIKRIQKKSRIHFQLSKLFFFFSFFRNVFFFNEIFYFFGDLTGNFGLKKYIFSNKKNNLFLYYNRHQIRNIHFQIFTKNVNCNVNTKIERYHFSSEILCRIFSSFFLNNFKKKEELKIYKRIFKLKNISSLNERIFFPEKKKDICFNPKHFFFSKIKTRLLKFLYFTFLNFNYFKKINLINLIAYYKKTPNFLWIVKNFLFSDYQIMNKNFYFVLNKLKECFVRTLIQKLILNRPELFFYSIQKKNNNLLYIYCKKFKFKVRLFFHFLVCSYDLFNIFFYFFFSNKEKNTFLVINVNYKYKNRKKLCFYIKNLNIIYNFQEQKQKAENSYFIKKKEEKIKLIPIFQNLKLNEDLMFVFREFRKKKNNLKFLIINFFKKIFSNKKNIIFQFKMFFIFFKKIYNLKKIVKNSYKILNCCLFCSFKLSKKYYLNVHIKNRKKFIKKQLILFFLKKTLFLLNFTKTTKLVNKNITWLFDDLLKKRKELKTNTEYMFFFKYIYLHSFYNFQCKFGSYVAICILIGFNLKIYQVLPKNINFIRKFTLLYFLQNFFECKKEPFIEYIFHFLKKRLLIFNINRCYISDFLNSLLSVKISNICKGFRKKLYSSIISESFKTKNVTRFLKRIKISVHLYKKNRKKSKKKIYSSNLNKNLSYVFENYEYFLNDLPIKKNAKKIFFFPTQFCSPIKFLYKSPKSFVSFSFHKIIILFYFIFLMSKLTSFSKSNNLLNYIRLSFKKTNFGDFFAILVISQFEFPTWMNFNIATLTSNVLLKRILIDIRLTRYKFLFFKKFIHSNKKKKLYFSENKMYIYLREKIDTSKKISKNIDSGNTKFSKIIYFLCNAVIKVVGEEKLYKSNILFVCFFFKKIIFSLCLNCICMITDFYFDFLHKNKIIYAVYLIGIELKYIKIKNSFCVNKDFSDSDLQIRCITFAQKMYIILIRFFCIKYKIFFKKKNSKNLFLICFRLKSIDKKVSKILHSTSKNYFLCSLFEKFSIKHLNFLLRLIFIFKTIYLTDENSILIKQISLIKIWANFFCKKILFRTNFYSEYRFNFFYNLLLVCRYFLSIYFQIEFLKKFDKKCKKSFICDMKIEPYMMVRLKKKKIIYFLFYFLKMSFVDLKNYKKEILSKNMTCFFFVFSKIKFLFKKKAICLNFLKNIYIINKDFIIKQNEKSFLIFCEIVLILSKLKTIFLIKSKFFLQFFKSMESGFLYKKKCKAIIYAIIHRVFIQIPHNSTGIGYFKKFIIYVINIMIFSKLNVYRILGVKFFFLPIKKNLVSRISYFLCYINFLLLDSFFLPIKLMFNNIVTLYLFFKKLDCCTYKFKRYLFLLLETKKTIIRINTWYLILNLSINVKIFSKKNKIKYSPSYQDLKIKNLEIFFFTLTYKLLNVINKHIIYKNFSIKKIIYSIFRNKFKYKTSTEESCVFCVKKNSFQIGYMCLSLFFFKLNKFDKKYTNLCKQIYVLFYFLNYKKALKHFFFDKLKITFNRHCNFFFSFFFYQIYLNFFKDLYKGNIRKIYSNEGIFFFLKISNEILFDSFFTNENFFLRMKIFSLKFFCFLFTGKRKFCGFYKYDTYNVIKKKYSSFFFITFLNFLEERIYLKTKFLKNNTFRAKKNFLKKNRYNYYKHLKNFATDLNLFVFF